MKQVMKTIAGLLPMCLCISNMLVLNAGAVQGEPAAAPLTIEQEGTGEQPQTPEVPEIPPQPTEEQPQIPQAPAEPEDVRPETPEVPAEPVDKQPETPETTGPEAGEDAAIQPPAMPETDPAATLQQQSQPVAAEVELYAPTTVQELLELADTVDLGNVENDTYRKALATLLGGDEVGFPLLPQEIRDSFTTMEETLNAALKNTDLHMQIYFVKNAQGDRSPVLYAAHTGVITGSHGEKWKAVGVYNADEDLWYMSTAAHTYQKTVEGRDVAKLRTFIGTEEVYTMLKNTAEWIPVGTATEEPDDNDPVVPDDNNPVVPDDNNPVVPDDNNPVVPDDNNPVVPDDNEPVVPDDNNPVVPDDNNPIVPDEDNTTTPDEDTEIEIEEDDVPLANLPETTQPEQGTGIEDVLIEDEATPLAQAPVQEVAADTAEELIIVETEVPLGNLPNTGTPVNTNNGLAGLALFASIAATGAFVLSRKAD